MLKKLNNVKDKVLTGSDKIVIASMCWLSSIAPTKCNAIWDVSDSAATSIIKKFSAIYRKWSWLALLANAIGWFCTKDDKTRGIFKKACIGILIVYILTYLESLFTGTMSGLAGFFQK